MARESTGTLITSAISAVGTGAMFLKAYDELRSLYGPSFDIMNEYVNCMETNLRKMNGTAQMLFGTRNDVLDKINKDKENKPTWQCQAWIYKVNELEKEVKLLESEFSTANKKSFKERFEFSKVLEKINDELRDCLDQGSKIQVLVERTQPIVEVRPPEIKDKSSLYTVFTKMTGYFEDKDVKRIGLWGTVGVGKTAIMKNLNNSEQAKAFDIVIFATLPDEISQEMLKDGMNQEKLRELKLKALELAKEKLRREIAGRLRLKTEGMTKDEINSKISEELNDKKYLFLLDDVWCIFTLDDIGIRSNDKGSKVILASRKRDICCGMDIDAIEEVKSLSTEEAVALFKEKLGAKGKSIEFGGIAKPVVMHCSCLPLLIEKVAGFFKQKDPTYWRDMLRNFQKWLYCDFEGMVEVLNKMRFCFEGLDDKDKKLCFLYCALHTEGCKISTTHLVECCKAEKFVTEAGRGRIIVGDLIDASLLEKDEKKKYVRMNKVLRNMALKISSEWEDLKFLAKAGGLDEPLSDREWEEAKRISLMDNNDRLSSLPEKPNCTNLSTLFLQRNFSLTTIPDKFFESMKRLRVLDLHGTKVTTLPSPFCLEDLEVLYLSCCDQLMELPSEMKLENLEVLDIRGTGIYCLPIQVGNMRKLRCLRFSINGESGREEEHQSFISCLYSLKELIIEVKAGNQRSNNVATRITREVAKLTELTSLSFCFHDRESFKAFLNNGDLWQDANFTFQICVGDQHSSTRCLKSEKVKNIDNAVISSLVVAITNDTYEVIGRKEALSLLDFGIENINDLKCCIIEGCKEMVTVVDAHGTTQGLLKGLERIYISNMLRLKSIWEDHVSDGSLSQLTVVCLYKCSEMKKIFSPAMIRQLSKLQHLEIKDCDKIEQIIEESENNGSEHLELPNFRTLILHNLPKLICAWKENSLKHPPLMGMHISDCPELLTYPF